MTVWLVRAGRSGEREDLALREGLAVIGWDELPDLSILSKEQLGDLLRQHSPEKSNQSIGNTLSQLWSFANRIEDGDIIALPLKKRSAIAFGKASGPYEYRASNPDGAKHVRPVEWIRDDVPRSAIDQDILYSLGAFLTVCQIRRNNAEERIRALLEGRSLPLSIRSVDPESEPSDEELETPRNIDEDATDQIREHIGRKFRGHELSRLVNGVLEAQGYQTQVAEQGPDGGVDIIAGRGPLGFEPPRMVVQVKSSDSPADVKVLRELRGVMQTFGADQGLFVSWGGYKRTVLEENRKQFFEVRLWDADDLIEAISEHYESMPDDLQAELPLKRIWTLVLEE